MIWICESRTSGDECLFVKDKDDGDAYGEAAKAFGAEWYTLAPSGNKVDTS
jgi:hypothetical protein